MPITDSFTSKTTVRKGKGHVHTEQWHRCWQKVQGQGHSSSSAAAICTSSIGYEDSLNKKPKKAAEILKWDPAQARDNSGRWMGAGRAGDGVSDQGTDVGMGTVRSASGAEPDFDPNSPVVVPPQHDDIVYWNSTAGAGGPPLTPNEERATPDSKTKNVGRKKSLSALSSLRAY